MPNDQGNENNETLSTNDSFGRTESQANQPPVQSFDMKPTTSYESQGGPATPDDEPNSVVMDETPPTATPDIEREPETVPIQSFGAALPPETTNSATPVTGSVLPPHPSKGGKKKWIIGGAVVAVLALLGGGSALAYTMYQNPDKVVLDSVVNLLSKQPTTIDGNLGYTSDDGKFTVEMSMKNDGKLVNGTLKVSADIKESNLQLEGNADFAVESNGNGYVKLNDVDKLAKTAVDALVDYQAEQYKSYGTAMTPQQVADAKKQALDAFQPFINKINNKWIKFAADEKSDTSEDQKCVSDALAKLRSDAGVRKEISDAYSDNKFVVIKEKLGLKDGSYGYVLKVDDAKLKSFAKAAESTELVKDLNKCGDGKAFDADDIDTDTADKDTSNGRVELWVSQWSHQLTAVNISGSSTEGDSYSIQGSVKFDYKPVSGLSVPKDAVDSEELMNDVSSLLFGGGASSTTSTSI